MNTDSTPRSPVDSMAAIRKVNRLRRLARGHRHLIGFYLEHNLTDAARDMRVTMLEHLHGACRQWRTALGLTE